MNALKLLVFVVLLLLSNKVICTEESRDIDEDNSCLERMRKVFAPEGFKDLTQMFLNTGKGPNQLGNYDACDADGLDYVVLIFETVYYENPILRLGICSPKECNSEEHFESLSQFLLDKVKPFIPYNRVNTRFVIPREEAAKPMATGGIIFCAVTGVIILFWFIGMLISYTNIGDNSNIRSRKVEERKTKWALAFHSFNPIINLQKLFTISSGGDKSLSVLNGVRVMSIIWVILGHSFSFLGMAATTNDQSASALYDSDLFSIVPGGYYAVDTFFFLSGFLTFALLIYKIYPKRGIGIYDTFLVYFHRYYRLIFPLVFVQFLVMYVMEHLGSGPLYKVSWGWRTKLCFQNPWSNFLFIANFYPWKMADSCLGWLWYLMCDMQFFIMSPPLIILYCKNRRIGKLLVVSLITISMLINGILTLVWDLSMDWKSSKKTNVGDLMYNKPWSRMGAYFVGAMFGISYFELSCREKYQELSRSFSNKCYLVLKNSRVISLVVCCFGIGLTSLYVFPLAAYTRYCRDLEETNCWPLSLSFFHNLTSRPFFVAGVGLIIAPTFVGRLRVIRGFLGAESFAILARLNYVVYLIQSVVLAQLVNNVRASIYVDTISQIFFTIGAIAVSFIVAIPLTLICEVPFMNLEKYILFPKKPSKNPSSNLELPCSHPTPPNTDTTADSKTLLLSKTS
ncbi:unnamed protein product [Moneuplotes crassus]|uniref:Acyltransferase 3 domain-containing protein n=2 Tax=Euplotes crassus TaxID=5936 RepID=A0AAD1U311_EUPCR|nr:unnamed protein product [Moneuplotes crassus]